MSKNTKNLTLSVVILSAFAAIPSWGMGKGRTGDYQYNPAIFESHRDALARSFGQVEEKIGGNVQDLESATQFFVQKAQAAEQAAASLGNQIKQMDTQKNVLKESVGKNSDALKALELKIIEDPRNAATYETQAAPLKAAIDKDKKTIIGLDQQVAAMEIGLKDAEKEAADMRSRVHAKVDELSRGDKSVQLSGSESSEEMKQKMSAFQQTYKKKELLRGSEQVIDQLYDEVKDDLVSSKLLFMDLEMLKDKIKTLKDDEVRQKFFEKTFAKLNETLMGKYVEKRIEEALCGPRQISCLKSAISDSAGKVGESAGGGASVTPVQPAGAKAQ